MHRWKRKRLFNKDYIVTLRKLLLFRTFYGDFTIKKLKSFFKKTNKRRLDYISKCLFLFESRMDILLYRLNFFKSPRESRNFIRNKNMKINKKINKILNCQLYINDVIEVKHKFKKYFHEKIITNLENRRIIFNYPKYLEINYRLLKCMFILHPKQKEITNIVKFDWSFIKSIL